jgi:hypothetical protein
MNTAINELAIAVFKRPLDECGLDEMQQLAHQYPYFVPLQLFTAKKLKPANSELFKEQAQKTSLYFQNRLWLEHLLNESTSKIQIMADTHDDTEEKQLTEYENLSTTEEPVEPTLADESNEGKITDETTIAENAETIAENAEQNESRPSFEIPKLKIEPLNDANAEFTFQPYHTVDYFASQGVKFKEDEKPKDRFGQQLKSFTEWLKTMKRLPVSEIIAASDTNVEKKVEELAEHSIEDRDVVTEAMAEVWEKQGNHARAEEIYRKLSLLDPPKSSYFAAKIDQIKKNVI